MNQNIPQMSGMPQVIITNVPQEPDPIPVEEILAKSDYVVSKQMALGLMHQGVRSGVVTDGKLTEPTWKTEPTYEEVDGVKQYVEAEDRPLPFATTDDAILYDMKGSSSSGDTGLLAPDELGIWSDLVQSGGVYVEYMPGQMNGPTMTEDNHYSMPGWPVRLTLFKIQGYVTKGDASELTIDDLNTLGLSSIVDDDKLDAYKKAIAAAAAIPSIDALRALIIEVNNGLDESSSGEDSSSSESSSSTESSSGDESSSGEDSSSSESSSSGEPQPPEP